MNYTNILTGYDSKYLDSTVGESCQPVMFTLDINSSSDLSTKVIKSKTASVELPELDIRILPGLNSKDLVCDVFGLLCGIENAIKMGLSVETSNEEEVLKKIIELKDGTLRTTLVLIDPAGLSLIMGKAERELLNT